MDMNLYMDRPLPDTAMQKQITAYIDERFPILDQLLGVDEK